MPYQHNDSLFSGTVDWDLIATHLPDMLRVGVSIAAGSITPSTILRGLGTYSRKNRLFQSFRELGVVVRSAFLLQYIGDAELRSTIQTATNKSASFTDFVKWLAFGGGGVIAENDRGEQRKIIKYNHWVGGLGPDERGGPATPTRLSPSRTDNMKTNTNDRPSRRPNAGAGGAGTQHSPAPPSVKWLHATRH